MSNQIRIIGGKWRSRKIKFPDSEGLRPTADRLRETLFNWLQNSIYDAVCLDAFAGSGILGFEALSRGAKQVLSLEKSYQIAKQVKENAKILNAENLFIENTDALCFFKKTELKFDFIFLDPPFKENLLDKCLALISEKQLLKAEGKIYIEFDKQQIVAGLNAWQVLKETKAGNVRACLLSEFK